MSSEFSCMYLTFSAPVAGAMCQRFGCRSVSIFGGLICTIATLAAAFSPNVPFLFTMMCLSGKHSKPEGGGGGGGWYSPQILV